MEAVITKLKDAFKELTLGGMLFDYINAFTPPWGNDSDLVADLDTMYFHVHSGEKITSPFIDSMIGDTGYVLPTSRIKIASVINNKFRTKWERLWATYGNIPTYNPIFNYDMREEVTEDKDLSSTSTSTEETENSSTRVNSDTSTYYSNTFENTDPAGKMTDRSVVNSNSTDDGSSNKESTNTVERTDASTLTRTRRGNIGVTTSQNMIKQEREVWFWNYFDEVFKDIDSILACSVY